MSRLTTVNSNYFEASNLNGTVVLVFYYLFNELGINFANTAKMQWVRFLAKITGCYEQSIRNEINIDFESTKTKRNLKIMADLFRELLPKISTQIDNGGQ